MNKTFKILSILYLSTLAVPLITACTQKPALVNFEYAKSAYDCGKIPEINFNNLYCRIEPGIVEANVECRKLIQSWYGMRDCIE